MSVTKTDVKSRESWKLHVAKMNFVSEKCQLQSQGSVFTVSFSISEEIVVGFIHSGLGICLIVYSKLIVNVSVNGCLSPWNSTSLGFNILHLWGWRCCDLILQIKLTKSAGFSWPSSQGSGPASLTQGCWRETSPQRTSREDLLFLYLQSRSSVVT